MNEEFLCEIDRVFQKSRTPEAIFSELMPALGRYLSCDRCFLYLRDPQTSFGRVEFCWVRNEDIPTIYDDEWKQEPDTLISKDPMFAAALRTESSIFVNDVINANPKILNQAFENSNFGHRALIHAHLCQDNKLWGILQPCVFNNSRNWNERERQLIYQVVLKITPLAVQYIKAFKQ